MALPHTTPPGYDSGKTTTHECARHVSNGAGEKLLPNRHRNAVGASRDTYSGFISPNIVGINSETVG
jgi:hypothetical protein